MSPRPVPRAEIERLRRDADQAATEAINASPAASPAAWRAFEDAHAAYRAAAAAGRCPPHLSAAWCHDCRDGGDE